MKISRIIMSVAVVVFCAGTLLIAVDQVAEARAKSAKWKRMFLREREDSRRLSVLLEEERALRKETEEELRWETENRDADLPQWTARAKAEGRRELLEEKKKEPPARTRPGFMAPWTHSGSAPVVHSEKSPPKPWQPPRRHLRAQQIKERAEVIWKHDPAGTLHEMERQKKALATLMDHNRFPANKELLAIAAEKWSPDYSMMLMEFRFLVEVQRDLDRRGQPPVPGQPPTPE